MKRKKVKKIFCIACGEIILSTANEITVLEIKCSKCGKINKIEKRKKNWNEDERLK